MAAPQLPVELSLSIERCAAALGDLTRLKGEVARLKATGDGLAHFASALFELEMARQGDPDGRAQLTHLAEVLLVFWRDGAGDELARRHPSLQSLWRSVAPMLAQFEMRRLELALATCWKHRDDPKQLAEDIEALQPPGHRRVEFARCVYHLELARQGIESSRVEFAQRAGLLAEAYQDSAIATELIGHDPGLRHLWGELMPYLDEFFEALEEQAARAQEGTKKVRIPSMPVIPPGRAVALGDDPQIPSFRTLVSDSQPLASPPLRPARPPPAPPPPSHATPPGGLPEAEVLLEEEVMADPPPPPLDLTPPGSWKPPQLPGDDLEISEADFGVPPPPPALTPAYGLAAVVAEAEDIEVDFEPDEATLAFWDYTFAALQQAPVDGQKPRMLATESRTDRKRLTTWLDGMGNHLAVPEARAFAALVRLVLAGETKEKSLFGQDNPRRKEALEAAFSLLAPTPEAAGKAAVWFELDGTETRDSLGRGLELLYPFLAFCCRHSLDPLLPATVAKYLEES